MVCSACGSEQAADTNFCHQCGTRLAVLEPGDCPHCGSAVPVEARFCATCGRSLIASEQSHLQQYVPRELLDKLKAARAEGVMAGERRVVTMLFCDIKGSTAMAEALDPEEWTDIMNGAFEHLIAPIYRYEGTLARLMGDAILAFFGAPIAHEDDPQRAVLAALDIVNGIRPYREQVAREWELSFDVRVGINTGLVVVGEVGSDLRVEYTAMGDAINLAARMEQTAEAGTVQISDDTYKLVAPLFEFEPLGDIAVKGKAEPVAAYRVIQPKAEPGRLRGVDGLATPLVGREAELDVLRNALTDLGNGSGRGSVVCLIGEAGLGKSRLIDEARHYQGAPDNDRWNESRSVSYESTRPYGQIQQHARSLCSVGESDSPEIAQKKIKQAIGHLIASGPSEMRVRASRVFETLLAMHAGEAASATAESGLLVGKAFKQELFESMHDVLRAWAREKPGVLVFDDLHWADPASVELLLHLIDLVNDTPILFICAFRPDEEVPSWQVKNKVERDFGGRASMVELKLLSEKESGSLARRLLAMEDVPRWLSDEILHKAEGNPLYVEEVIRTLIDSEALVQEQESGGWQVVGEHSANEFAIPAMPDTLRSLLTARIDRLDEGARRIVQHAAVIGRNFSYHVLQSIADASNLDAHLKVLREKGMIQQIGRAQHSEYAFQHMLMQEAAYESILKKQRRVYHGRVGAALEGELGGRLEENASLLAYHFYEAADNSRALRYYSLAGDAAARLYANAEAVTHYRRALEVARRVERKLLSTAQLIHLYSGLGRALGLTNRYDAALENYEDMEAHGREREEAELELEALMARATLRSTPTPVYDARLGEALSEEALAFARKVGNQQAESKILWNLLLLHTYTGAIQEAVAFGEQSLALARELELSEQLAYTLNDLHRAYMAIPDMERTVAVLDEARDLWREVGNKAMLADNLNGSANIYFLKGDYDSVVDASQEGYRVSQEVRSRWGQSHSRLSLSRVYFERGEMGNALSTLEESVRIGEEAGLAMIISAVRAELAWMYGSVGAIEGGLELDSVALSHEADNASPMFRSWRLAFRARLYVLAGDMDKAQEFLTQSYAGVELDGLNSPAALLIPLAEGELGYATGDYERVISHVGPLIARLRRWGVRSYLADALLLKGKALLASGKAEEASRALHEAQAAAEAIGSRRVLWPILMSRAELEREAGNVSAAEQLAQQAGEIVEFIAQRTEPEELRMSFVDMSSLAR